MPGARSLLLLLAALATSSRGATYPPVPVAFEPNVGQTSAEVKFLARGQGLMMFLTQDSAVFKLEGAVLRIRLDGAKQMASIRGEGRLPGTTNYLLGNDPHRWRRSVPHYAAARYQNVYPGIDLVYYSREGRIEYDFRVSPGADPARIRLAFDGDARPAMGPNGELVLRTPYRELCHLRPHVYQETASGKRRVEGQWMLRGGSASFALGAYDKSRTLVIDPVVDMTSSTMIGGTRDDSASAVALTPSGLVVVAGQTNSTDFPSVNAMPGLKGTPVDSFITIFDPALKQVSTSTVFGGSDADVVNALAVDSKTGYIYTAGSTLSTNFPGAVPGTSKQELTPHFAGMRRGFLTKFSPCGSVLERSNLFAATADIVMLAVAVNLSGILVVAGTTSSTTLATTTNAIQSKNAGGTDGFLVKYGASGSQDFASYFGASGDDQINGVHVDASGNTYIAGQTTGTGLPLKPSRTASAQTDFPVHNAYQSVPGGGTDAFVAKIGPTGTLLYSTLLGGSGDDIGYAITADSAGNAYVTGRTASTNFPTVKPIQRSLAARTDAFLTKFNPDGTGVPFSTYFGGNGDDEGRGVAQDLSGNIYVAGTAGSSNLPIVNAWQPIYGSSFDAFALKIDSAATHVMYSTYLGGAGAEQGAAITVTAAGEAYVAGRTVSADFPATTGAYQPRLAGAYDGFVAKLPAQTATAPRLALGGIVNAASYAFGGVSPGGLTTFFGFNLGPDNLVGMKLTAAGKVDTTVSDTRIYFDGVASPLIYTLKGQVSAVVPYSVAGKTITLVEAEYKGVKSGYYPMPVAAAGPGIFTLNAAGTGPGAILNQDGTVNGANQAAEKDSILVIYATGEGETTPAGVDGLVNTATYPKPKLAVGCSIGGKQAEIIYAGAAPFCVSGVLQVNVRVPKDAPSGAAVPIVLGIGQWTSQAGVTVAIK